MDYFDALAIMKATFEKGSEKELAEIMLPTVLEETEVQEKFYEAIKIRKIQRAKESRNLRKGQHIRRSAINGDARN